MNANRTKILSTTALIAILFIQIFWMWNTYNINARQLGKECNEILEKAIALELDKTNRCDSFLSREIPLLPVIFIILHYPFMMPSTKNASRCQHRYLDKYCRLYL